LSIILTLAKKTIYYVASLLNVNIEDVVERYIQTLTAHRFFSGLLAVFLLPPKFRESPLLFVHIPRSGGSSISSLLYGQSVGHFTAPSLKALLEPFGQPPTSFAVMRDPVQRCVSSYKFIRDGGAENARLHKYWRKRLRFIGNFDEYLTFLEYNISRLNRLDFVMREQSSFLTRDGELVVDYLYCWEIDKLTLTAMLQENGFFNLDIINRSGGNEITPTETQISRMKVIYARDYDLLKRIASGSDCSLVKREAEASPFQEPS